MARLILLKNLQTLNFQKIIITTTTMEGTEESSELMLMNFHSINHPTQTHNQENGIALTCTFDGNIILNLYLLSEKFGQAIRLLQSAYTEKTSEYEHVINEL